MDPEVETIAAIGTPRGQSALGIVRISGEKTSEILRQCLGDQKKLFESHRSYFGLWRHPHSGASIDEVVVLYFAKGRGFTGEESADIVCHGNSQILDTILESLLAAGARLARPGEFAYRAVCNGKMDLVQAESILALIQARSPKAAALALKNVRGSISRYLENVESEVTFVLANLEASIDFTTEDIQPVSSGEMHNRIGAIIFGIENILKNHVAAAMAREGFKVVLLGQPNSGKSSILNSLVGKDRSIVSSVPGTTRDTVDAEFLCRGYLVKIVDTAGLRESTNEIEIEGILRANREAQSSDLVVYVVDSAVGLQNRDVEFIKSGAHKSILICFNKSDLKEIDAQILRDRFALQSMNTISSSAVLPGGCDQLRQYIAEQVERLAESETELLVSSQRQHECLSAALESLRSARRLIEDETSPEFVAFELKTALIKIQETLGKNADDSVLDRVFSEFCIGK